MKKEKIEIAIKINFMYHAIEVKEVLIVIILLFSLILKNILI